jgi:hypothetical protein
MNARPDLVVFPMQARRDLTGRSAPSADICTEYNPARPLTVVLAVPSPLGAGFVTWAIEREVFLAAADGEDEQSRDGSVTIQHRTPNGTASVVLSLRGEHEPDCECHGSPDRIAYMHYLVPLWAIAAAANAIRDTLDDDQVAGAAADGLDAELSALLGGR